MAATNPVTILGVDPGLAATGYGIVAAGPKGFRYIGHGVISTKAQSETGMRLKQIYDGIAELIAQHAPTEAGVESLYAARNVTSIVPVAQARGVVLLALAQHAIAASEYPPQTIKQALVGQGTAAKEQVQELVRVLLGLSEVPRPDHASDALAAAICHYHNAQTAARIRGATGAE